MPDDGSIVERVIEGEVLDDDKIVPYRCPKCRSRLMDGRMGKMYVSFCDCGFKRVYNSRH